VDHLANHRVAISSAVERPEAAHRRRMLGIRLDRFPASATKRDVPATVQ
jgi:hypothetical protein